ncbi:nicotinate-nucleotide diphosphorylase [Commensalibacter oyaizuii]|uniref:Uncharacterized protein n=1 Tax=Commensalibacter oyaizuii TaxID=3043873 RepID=A0ABT6PYI5_9PROT|nr:hypothetical protein [Commensalibacter sp. TBRC 16381]MDI2089926.1 hypothetical protein [Commensalibacter sp. TBRC 16381]
MFFAIKSDLVNPFQPLDSELKKALERSVIQALSEKVEGNPVHQIFMNMDQYVEVQIIVDEDCILCGAPWVDSAMAKVSQDGFIQWHVVEGASVLAGDRICTLKGKLSDILRLKQVILNFLQFLSAIATHTQHYVRLVSDWGARIYHGISAIPGLEKAQQYAVRVGGGEEYLPAFYKGVYIQKHYVDAMGGVASALKLAFGMYPQDFVQIEVENLQQLQIALQCGAKKVSLFQFLLDDIEKAIALSNNQAVLEVYGGVHLKNVQTIAKMGIGHIVVETLTNDVKAISFSLSCIL